MNFTGIIIGAFTFLIIGLFHPLVVKGEYYFSAKIWPVFLVGGIIFCALSIIFSQNILLSSLFSITGFSSLWSISEIRHQKERVEKGWFPKNPKRRDD
ncbi:DUF4491 family protein [Treponema sp.]